MLGHWLLSLTFSDGKSGVADISDLAAYDSGVFVPLRDPDYFAKARLDPEAGTVVWPNGADPAPEYLRDHLIEDQQAKKLRGTTRLDHHPSADSKGKLRLYWLRRRTSGA